MMARRTRVLPVAVWPYTNILGTVSCSRCTDQHNKDGGTVRIDGNPQIRIGNTNEAVVMDQIEKFNKI